MKIIEAMKTVKRLHEKLADLQTKVAQHCADLEHETPVYPDQAGQIKEWLQSHFDTIQEIARLRTAIQRTNIATEVTIELGGKAVTKSIAEWIHRRRDLATADFVIYSRLGDRGLKEGIAKTSSGSEMQVKIRRYFDPKDRDVKMELYRSEPTIIDSTLEVINAVTDVIV